MPAAYTKVPGARDPHRPGFSAPHALTLTIAQGSGFFLVPEELPPVTDAGSGSRGNQEQPEWRLSPHPATESVQTRAPLDQLRDLPQMPQPGWSEGVLTCVTE